MEKSSIFEPKLRRLVVLKHVPFEGPAAIAQWAELRGCPTETINLYSGDSIPQLNSGDWLVVMGGPMNVDEEDTYPFLADEKKVIRRAVDDGQTVIGICLGAQLIASALGARVYPNSEREIGWLPIEMEPAAGNSPLFAGFPQTIEVFHWHGDTFDLPPGAKLIASSKGCKNQAFVIGLNVVGLQFHIETTPASAKELLTHGADDLKKTGEYVQTPEQICGSIEQCKILNTYLFELLNKLAAHH